MAQLDGKFIPLIPVRNIVIFPGISVPVSVGRPKSVAALEKAAQGDGMIVIVAQKSDESDERPKADDLYKMGTLCKVETARGSAANGYQTLIRGLARFKLTEVIDGEAMFEARGEEQLDDEDMDAKTREALVGSLKEMSRDILKLVQADTRQITALVDGIDDLALLTHLCAENADMPLARRQELLEVSSLKHRALGLLELMQHQKETLGLQAEIREKLSRKLGKHQREALLREQLRTIREELGEIEAGGGEGGGGAEDFKTRIEKAGMPADVKKVALEEAKRLKAIGDNSPEAHVVRSYLELLCELPWSVSSTDTIDLDKARGILDADHYGLDKIKRRIIEHLAVMKLKGGGRGAILLLVGPPGVGKTSLGQSVARALDREFVRVSLGGVRDEAEIRGHRRTYIGAMPGRIIQGVKRAGVNNPVMLLDELDKLGRGYSGDPAAALLEVLDPEQNVNFSDHYLEVNFDLSKVFFIATANSLETIPEPLLDRMEVIELSGYTTGEKLNIAKAHLVPKQLREHGVEPGRWRLTDEALLRVITHYTREAGVRHLERRIAALVRGRTEAVLGAAPGEVIEVGLAQLEEILGPEVYMHEAIERLAPPGVATGLAWTPHGGEILFIEARLMPGTGKLILTGKLGEIMKESAQIALSLVRSSLLIPGLDLERKDVHIHVPAGAIPKDGPSAGITMLTALASLFSGRSVPPTLAMTGEITLRGAVMPVGGIKEKVIAAHRAGVERIILSKRNEKDLREVPDEVRGQMRFIVVETAGEVLEAALGLTPAFMPLLGGRGEVLPAVTN